MGLQGGGPMSARDGPWFHGAGRGAQIGQCRPTSANVGRCRAMSAHASQCQPMSANISKCRPSARDGHGFTVSRGEGCSGVFSSYWNLHGLWEPVETHRNLFGAFASLRCNSLGASVGQRWVWRGEHIGSHIGHVNRDVGSDVFASWRPHWLQYR